MNYSCYVISNKPHLFENIEKSLYPEPVKYFDGTGYESFSKLVNSCAAAASTEIVIIMSDKVLPTAIDVFKAVSLINQGYGLVATYRFAFFGFKKQLFRQIGMMDERFVGGGFEDDDMYIRLHEANIAMYVTEEVPYTKSSSSWNYDLSRLHFINKWVDTENPLYDPTAKLSAEFIKRKLNEEILQYQLGNDIPTEFLTWERTVAIPTKSRKYIQGPKR
jgi:GT2 family glycosyltransferase